MPTNTCQGGQGGATTTTLKVIIGWFWWANTELKLSMS
jgi:hypothetical protein